MQGGGRERLVIVGNGMVGHRFLEMYGERAAAAGGGPFDVTVIGEEPRLAYDRVGLSGYFDGKTPDDLALTRPGQYEAAGFAVRLATRARRIDRERRVVEVDGAEVPYDRLLLATGSVAVRAAGSRARPARLFRLPHDRRSGGDLRLGRRRIRAASAR